MPLIAALILDRRERARVHGILRFTAGVRFCERATDLERLVSSGEAEVVLTELRDGDRMPVVPVIERIARNWPAVPILVYATLTPEDFHASMRAAASGAHGGVLKGVDDVVPTLRALIDEVRARSAATGIIRAIEPAVPNNVKPFIRFCARHGMHPLRVSDVAIALDIDRRTLSERLKRAGLPSAARIIGWMRLLHICRFLDDPGRTVTQAALQLGFPSGPSAANLTRRYTGLTFSQVRKHGGFHLILALFEREMYARD